MILQKEIQNGEIKLSVIVDYDAANNNVNALLSIMVCDESNNQIELADILGLKVPDAMEKLIDSIDWLEIYSSFKYGYESENGDSIYNSTFNF